VRLQTVPNSPWPVVLLHLGRFTRALNALDARLKPDLTPPARFCYISTMKALIQTGSSGRVPVPPEKRFLINERLEAKRAADRAINLAAKGKLPLHQKEEELLDAIREDKAPVPYQLSLEPA